MLYVSNRPATRYRIRLMYTRRIRIFYKVRLAFHRELILRSWFYTSYVNSTYDVCCIILQTTANLGKFPGNSYISQKSGNFRKIREFRKMSGKISGISGKTFLRNFGNSKIVGNFFCKFHVFYKNRSAQQCTCH
jgi:hypothetical protein